MSRIKFIRGNIFNSSMGTLVNTVNTVGFMGAGIALEYKRRYPEMYDEYKLKCLNGELKIGKLHVWKKEEQWILNFPTKIHYSNQSKIEYINRGLEEFIVHPIITKFTSVNINWILKFYLKLKFKITFIRNIV